MTELLFKVEENPDEGYTAKALGFSIFTQANSYDVLKASVIDDVHCHFDDEQKRIIRLRYVKDEIIFT